MSSRATRREDRPRRRSALEKDAMLEIHSIPSAGSPATCSSPRCSICGRISRRALRRTISLCPLIEGVDVDIRAA